MSLVPVALPAFLPRDPPLTPSPDEARSKLRRELLRPEYNEQNLVQRFLSWVERQLGKGLDAAADAPPLSTLAAMVILVGLVALLGWLLSRARRTARTREEDRAVLTDEIISADELRARAEAALAAARHEDALVDGFRAVATRQVERGRLADAPGATAHEVALALGREFPHLRGRVDDAGALFDAVLYGDRAATAAQAASVIALDDELLVRR
ncbi:DUF4129 domain-containing protein [Nocardioides dilutus]